MVEGDLKRFDRSKSISFSHPQFRLQIESLDCATREGAVGCEPIHDQGFVEPEHFGDFLQGFQTEPHGPSAPGVEKPAGNLRVDDGPEPLEVLPEKIGLEVFRLSRRSSESRMVCFSLRFSGRFKRANRPFSRRLPLPFAVNAATS